VSARDLSAHFQYSPKECLKVQATVTQLSKGTVKETCAILRSKYGLCSYDGVDALKYSVFQIFFHCSL